MADKLGLSGSAFHVLYTIYDSGQGCTQKDICLFTGLPKQTVHSSVRKMIDEGYLRSETTGKAVRLYFTDAGSLLAKRCIKPVQDAEEAAFGVMSEQECLEFLRLSTRYVEGLKVALSQAIMSK